MKILFIASILSFSFFGCSQQPKKIINDFSCIEEDLSGVGFGIGSDLENQLLGQLGKPISLKEEITYGDSLLVQIKKEYVFITNGPELQVLYKVLWKLKNQIKFTKGFDYKIYYIQSDELNSFTIGGKIFFTSGMYKFCENEDEIASIIGHEIGHNELGHIRDNLSRIKTMEEFGEIGTISVNLGKMLITPFNQKNEVASDFYGLDLAFSADYDACQNIKLWKRMQESEGTKTMIDSFMSSHPCSGARANCSRNHLITNYNISCPN